MKLKVTKKQIKENYKFIIEASYCELQDLLSYKNSNFYTCGVYGWNADIYEISNNICIVTGYAPFGNIEKHELNKKYNKKAEKIHYNSKLTYTQKQKKLEKLISKYINECLGV